MVQMRLVVLGTSAAVPTEKRGLSSIALLRGSELILIDAGEGVQRSLSKANLGYNRKTKVLITHLHGDHCVGLLGLMQTMSMVNREKPLDIYGPKGIDGFIRQNLKYLRFALTYPVNLHIIKKEGLVVDEDEYSIRAARAVHSTLTYGYLLEEKLRPGVFFPDKAQALGVTKVELWSRLQHGHRVRVAGRVVKPEDVLGPVRGGRKVGFSGDTRPTKHLAKFFHRCDVLVFDSTYSDRHAAKAVENLHSTAREAAELARSAGVRELILTHFSARYDDASVLESEARQIHPRVIAAYDQMNLAIPYSE